MLVKPEAFLLELMDRQLWKQAENSYGSLFLYMIMAARLLYRNIRKYPQ